MVKDMSNEVLIMTFIREEKKYEEKFRTDKPNPKYENYFMELYQEIHRRGLLLEQIKISKILNGYYYDLYGCS
jgi:hypothetical protein